MLPVVHVNLLTKGPQPIQSQGLPDSGDLILEMVWEAGVKQAMKCAISIVLDLGCKVVEVHDVPSNMVCVLHPEMLELVLSICDWVVRSKGTLEFCDKMDPAGSLELRRSSSNHSSIIPFR